MTLCLWPEVQTVPACGYVTWALCRWRVSSSGVAEAEAEAAPKRASRATAVNFILCGRGYLNWARAVLAAER